VSICASLSTTNVLKIPVLRLKRPLPLPISQIHTLNPMLLALCPNSRPSICPASAVDAKQIMQVRAAVPGISHPASGRGHRSRSSLWLQKATTQLPAGLEKEAVIPAAASVPRSAALPICLGIGLASGEKNKIVFRI